MYIIPCLIAFRGGGVDRFLLSLCLIDICLFFFSLSLWQNLKNQIMTTNLWVEQVNNSFHIKCRRSLFPFRDGQWGNGGRAGGSSRSTSINMFSKIQDSVGIWLNKLDLGALA